MKEDKRAPGGVEVQLTSFAVLALTTDYPITPKEHGTAFLMEHRHLWLRSSRQRAALRECADHHWRGAGLPSSGQSLGGYTVFGAFRTGPG